uniref:Battenin n=1 Tax=Rhabditophanes sp. KR3021 TaxID=114890 RepID=A0AC35UHQ7_9BILA
MSGIVLIPLANMKKDKFFKFYSKLSNDDQSRPMLSAGGNNHEAPKEHMHMFAHMKIARNSINLFMINFVTFACFPSILNEIEPSQESASYYLIVPKNCFSVVTTFLVFGIFMLLGNILANHIKINEKIVWIPSVARILFIPFFFFCNYRTNVRTFPVFVTNQWILISTVGLFGISGGYLSSLSITYSTKTVSLSKSHVVFMLTSFIGSLGTVIGYIFTSTLIDIIDNCGPLTALQLSGKPIIETIANVTELITSNVTEIINVNNISDAINTTMQTTINSTLL